MLLKRLPHGLSVFLSFVCKRPHILLEGTVNLDMGKIVVFRRDRNLFMGVEHDNVLKLCFML